MILRFALRRLFAGALAGPAANLAARHQAEALDHIAILVVQVGAKEMSEKGPRVAANHVDQLHDGNSFGSAGANGRASSSRRTINPVRQATGDSRLAAAQVGRPLVSVRAHRFEAHPITKCEVRWHFLLGFVGEFRYYAVNTTYIQCVHMAESGFRIRIDNNLRQAFKEACQSRDQTAAQVVRAFMRDYVEKVTDNRQAELFPHDSDE